MYVVVRNHLKLIRFLVQDEIWTVQTMFLATGWYYYTGKYRGKNVIEPSGQMSETLEFFTECVTSGRLNWAANLLLPNQQQQQAEASAAQDNAAEQQPIKFRITVHRAGTQQGVNYSTNALAMQCGSSTCIAMLLQNC